MAGSHERVLDHAFGVIFAIFTGTILLQVTGALVLAPPPQRARLALFVVALLATAAAVRALRGGFVPRLAVGLFVATALGLLAVRIDLGAHQHETASVLLLNPAIVAAAALFAHRWLIAPAALVLLVCGVWDTRSQLPAEQASTTLATFTLVVVATGVMRRSARRADLALTEVHRELAVTHAQGEALRYRQEAARRVHDDVLSAVKMLSLDRPWSPAEYAGFAAQARRALELGPAANRATPVDLPTALGQLCDEAGPLTRFIDLGCPTDLPASVVLAVVGAVAELLRNVDLHAGVRAATVTLGGSVVGGDEVATPSDDDVDDVVVTVSDEGRGFETHHVGRDRQGLRDGVTARMEAVGGRADIVSALDQGTTARLRWTRAGSLPPRSTDRPRPAARGGPPMLWLSGMRFTAGQVMVGFFLAPLLSFVLLFLLHLDDVRMVPACVAIVGLGVVGIRVAPLAAALAAAPRQVAVGLLATLVFTALGILAVEPGTTDGFAYWASGLGSIPLAGVVATVGPRAAVSCLVAYLAVLVGALVAGHTGLHPADAVGVLGAPPVAVAFIAGLRLGFQRHERQLAQAQTAELEASSRLAAEEAIAAADEASVAAARELCEPLLRAVEDGDDADAVRRQARTTLALLRQDLTAPRLVAGLFPQLRQLAEEQIEVVLVDSREHDGPLGACARELLRVLLDARAEQDAAELERVALWLEDLPEADVARSQESLMLRVEAGPVLVRRLSEEATRRGLTARETGASVTVTAGAGWSSVGDLP